MGTESYPGDSIAGPIIAITNEYAGSDGDIFSHSFKLMNIGKLIGKRTWGGVIGIWPRNLLVDGTITTQPEFSFWFKDVGWDVENYGTDVNIEVDITPKDYSKGIDTQLDRGIKEILLELKKNPVIKPNFENKPSNLWQHFCGVEIETEKEFFDDEIFNLMDFACDQKNEVHFFYTLPFTKKNALVETTWISNLSNENIKDYNNQIDQYLKNHLNVKNYKINFKFSC